MLGCGSIRIVIIRYRDFNIWYIWIMERKVRSKIRDWGQKIIEGIKEKKIRNCRC